MADYAGTMQDNSVGTAEPKNALLSSGIPVGPLSFRLGFFQYVVSFNIGSHECLFLFD